MEMYLLIQQEDKMEEAHTYVECLQKAIKNKGLEKTLKISGISSDVIEQLKKQIGDINE